MKFPTTVGPADSTFEMFLTDLMHTVVTNTFLYIEKSIAVACIQCYENNCAFVLFGWSTITIQTSFLSRTLWCKSITLNWDFPINWGTENWPAGSLLKHFTDCILVVFWYNKDCQEVPSPTLPLSFKPL